MELLIKEEIKTYGHYSKGREGEGQQCLGCRVTRSFRSVIIKVRERWLGTGPDDQACSRLLALPPEALLFSLV